MVIKMDFTDLLAPKEEFQVSIYFSILPIWLQVWYLVWTLVW